MPILTAKDFDLEAKSPSELEQRRREIIAHISTFPQQENDDAVPFDLLRELAAITSTLRRRNSGPPKTANVRAKKPRTKHDPDTLKDLLT